MPVTINNGNLTLTSGQSNLVSDAKWNGSVRAVLALTNTEATGGNTITIAVGQEAAANKGIVLLPGQTFTWSTDGGYRPPSDRVNAYCAAGSPVLAIYEEVFTRN